MKWIKMILSLFGLIEKSIPSDHMREQKQDTRQPLADKDVQDTIEKREAKDWAHIIKTFSLNIIPRLRVIRQVSHLEESDAVVTDVKLISRKPAHVEVHYTLNGKKYVTVMKDGRKWDLREM